MIIELEKGKNYAVRFYVLLWVGAVRQNGDHIDDGKIPLFILRVPMCAHGLIVE